jgi:hypothetical protein
MPRALLLTIGTGDAANLETSLFHPLLLSIGTGEWQRVVLLPSQVSGLAAEEVRRPMHAAAIIVSPLPRPGAENDPDACFDHFDRTIEALLAADFAATDLVADFTRGTKAMSAALVLAALRHGVPTLRYVGGDQRDQRGMVVPGSERIHETRTARATARRRIDLARNLFEHGAFGAALALLPDPENRFAAVGWDIAERESLRALRPLVQWFAAWDRLDYEGAIAVKIPAAADLPPAWRRHLPPAVVMALVTRLAAWPRDHRLIAIDLLANAERRVGHGHYEDALVRCYNMIERVARARLYDSGHMVAGRANAIEALQVRRDPMAVMLRDIDHDHPSLQPRSRNDSILIHGLSAQGSRDPREWGKLFKSLENVLHRDAELRHDSAALDRDIAAARFPNFRATP